MVNKLRRCDFKVGGVVLMVGLLAVSLILEGCEPLRKKFTRKKKDVKEVESIPLLEPMEYPAKVYSTAETYKQHYALWNVWQKELSTIMLDRDNGKRKVYLLDHVILNLQALKSLVVHAKQWSIDKNLKALKEIRNDLTAAMSTRSMSTLKLSLSQIEKAIRNEFKFEAIKDYLKP